MNVSLEKEMWEEENFEKHLEGIGKMGKEDKIHQFTYYQWGAFFFLMQVGNLALKNKLSSCKWTQTKLKANLAKTLQFKLSGQAAYFAAPRLLWRGLEGGAMDALVKAVEKAKATKKVRSC